MTLVSHLRLSFWLTVIGAVVVYGFFVTVASISPTQVAGLSAVIAAMAIVFTARNIRVANELADPGGDPHLRRHLNKMRERRGF